MEPERARGLSEDDLERGLAAGFAAQAPAAMGESVIRAIEGFADARPAATGAAPPGEPGRYRVTGELGRGGVGVVYAGTDRDLDREVALKVLRPDRATSGEMARRFLDEAKVESWLEHPGVPPIYDVGQVRECIPFFAMKLVKGRPFSVMLAARKEVTGDQRRHLGVFLRVCETVAYAHARGVIHRDLKPGNVMVGYFGEVHVVDWGFAKLKGRDEAALPAAPQEAVSFVADRHALTDGSRSTPGSIMGTPPYMPPEQARGEAVDERADVFALGAILSEILTGQPPYVGEKMLVYFMAAEARLPECFERLDRCGAEAEWVSLAKRCLSAARGDRPRDAAQVAAEAAVILAGAEERARQAEVSAAAERARRVEEDARERVEREWEALSRAARRRARLVAAVVLCAVLATGALFLTRQATERRRATEGGVAAAAALREASRCEGAGDFAGATAWAARAVETARAKGADTMMVARAGAEFERIHSAALAAAEMARKTERNRALLERIDHIETVEAVASESWQYDFDAAYGRVFRGCGLDPDATPPADLATEIAAGGEEEKIAAVLASWAWHRWTSESKGEAGGRRLLVAAGAVFPNPLRDRLMVAYSAKDYPAVRRALSTADPRLVASIPLRFMPLGYTEEEEVESRQAYLRAWRATPQARFTNHMLAFFALNRPGPASEANLRYALSSLALSPRLGCAFKDLAMALKGGGDRGRAESVARRATQLPPNHSSHWTVLAEILCTEGRSEEALLFLEEGLSRDSHPDEEFRLLEFKGFVLLQLGRHAEAVTILTGVAELAAPSASTRFLLAIALHGLGCRGEAAEQFALATTLPRGGYQNQLGCPRALLALGLVEEALRKFRHLVFWSPRDALFLSQLAIILCHLGRWEEAATRCEDLVRLQDSEENRSRLAFALYQAGRTDRAAEVAATCPGSARARLIVAEVLLARGDTAGALPELRKLVALDPDSLRGWRKLGELEWRAGRLPEARGAFERALALGPDDGVTLLSLGRIHLAEDSRKAVPLLKRATELSPSDPGRHYWYGQALGACGDLEGAEREAAKAAELMPEGEPSRDFRVQALTFLASTRQNRGNWEQAVKDWREVLEHDPKSSTAITELAFELLIHEDPAQRDPKEARRLIELLPAESIPTLLTGLVLLREGQAAEVLALLRSAKFPQRQMGWAWFVAAAAHAALGQAEAARGALRNAEGFVAGQPASRATAAFRLLAEDAIKALK